MIFAPSSCPSEATCRLVNRKRGNNANGNKWLTFWFFNPGRKDLLSELVRNPKRAAELFLQAGEQGNMQAFHNLAYMCFEGSGVARDYKAGLEWMRKAAHGGLQRSQFDMGFMLLTGKLGPT